MQTVKCEATKTTITGSVDGRDLLGEAGLRPTRQRLAVVDRLFGAGARHVAADSLYAELVKDGAPGSLSCVYNSLRRFSEIGLIRRVPIYGTTAYFDTQLSHHHHFYMTDEDRLVDIPRDCVTIAHLPTIPAGYELVSVDVLLRIKNRLATS